MIRIHFLDPDTGLRWTASASFMGDEVKRVVADYCLIKFPGFLNFLQPLLHNFKNFLQYHY